MEDSRMDDSVRAAIARSFLADLPRPALERLLSGAALETVEAGATTYRAGGEPRLWLVVSGLFRSYFAGPDGRQVTVRYAREGDVLGVAGAQGGPAPLHVQAITDARRVQFDVDTLRELARNDAAVAWVLMGELTRTVHALWHEIAATAFATVPQRVARHLLEIAAREQEAEGGALVANVSQQELADLAGTVREVVARALRELRDERIVRVRRSGITVLDPAALASRAWPGDADR
ncbi:MAG TPA: Crp/Fnr family transcriptional regulator [Candidatus Limnocylindria bacterium]|nr:Crp/Fnr family transcriptional regulator [Candidatus Limnocylindria bacterium]